MFECFIQDNLITPNQSGFKAGDSCIKQLTSITHEICKSFDDGCEVRGVFIDTSKTFFYFLYQKYLTKYGTKVFTTN